MLASYRAHFKDLSRNVKLFLVGNAIQGMGLSIYSLLLNLYLKELGFGESVIGGLISTTSLGISLMAIPAAIIIERFHVKHLVVTGMVLSSLFYFLQILTIDEPSLFTFGLLACMFQALFNISISPFYLRNSTPQQRVHLFSMNSGANMFAHMVGYLIGGYLPKIIHWFNPEYTRIESYRGAIMFGIAVIFLSNLMFMRIRRVAIPKVTRPFLQELKDKEWRVLGHLIVPKLFLAFGGGMVIPFMNLYLKQKFRLSTDMVGVSYAILQLCIFSSIMLTPFLITRTTNLRFLVTTWVCSVPFMVIMGLTGNVTIVLCCFFLRGALMNMSSPISSMFEMERVSEKECVFASSMLMFSYHLMYTMSTRLGGILIEKFDFGPTFYMAGASYLVAAFLYHRNFSKEGQVRHLRPEKAVATQKTDTITEAA